MALEVVRTGSGFQQVPDYAGFQEAMRNGVKCWRLFNDTGSAIANRTPVYVSAIGMSASDTAGPRVVALGDDTLRHQLVVALEAVANQAWGWFAVQGLVDGMVRATSSVVTGHAFKVLDGAVASTGGIPAYADTEFAVYVGATNSALVAADVLLFGREFLATT
jgi:hypothetical protein